MKIVLEFIVHEYRVLIFGSFQMLNQFRFFPLSPNKVRSRTTLLWVRLFVLSTCLVYKLLDLLSMPPASWLYNLTDTWVVVSVADIKFKVTRGWFWLHVVILSIQGFIKTFHELNIYIVHKVRLLNFYQVKSGAVYSWYLNSEVTKQICEIIFIKLDSLLEQSIHELINFLDSFIYWTFSQMSIRSKNGWSKCCWWVRLFNRRSIAYQMSRYTDVLLLFTPSLLKVCSTWSLHQPLRYRVVRL